MAGLYQRIDDVGGQVDGLRVEIAGVRNEVAALWSGVEGLDGRLRAVEVAFGKVDQRLATIERVVLPASEDD